MNWILIWLSVFFLNCIGAWVSRLNNLDGKWFFWACALSIIAAPMFPLISRYSNNLLIDGIIYDIVIFFSYLITLFFLGCATKFTVITWLGVLLTIIGMVLMKV